MIVHGQTNIGWCYLSDQAKLPCCILTVGDTTCSCQTPCYVGGLGESKDKDVNSKNLRVRQLKVKFFSLSSGMTHNSVLVFPDVWI